MPFDTITELLHLWVAIPLLALTLLLLGALPLLVAWIQARIQYGPDWDRDMPNDKRDR